MKQFLVFICGFLLNFCILTLPIQGEIIETNEIKTMIPFINQESLVFLNVTRTLYAPSNTLADRRWRDYFSNRVNEIIENQEAEQELIDKVKNQIVSTIPKKNVQEITPRLIDLLQDKRIVVLGITQKQLSTSYADNFGEITRNHLLNLDINFEKTLKYFELSKENLSKSEFSFAYGLLFTNKASVGPAIVAFLKQSGKQPSNVVIVDNSRDNLESVQEALSSIGIAFTGIRYGLADAQEDFDPTLGTVEFFALINEGKILSDSEALQSMPADRSINYEAMLDKYIEQTISLDTKLSEN